MKSGLERMVYLDAKTYLDRRHTGLLNLPGNRQFDVVVTFDDWRDVEGVKFPFDITEERTGKEPVVTLVTYTEKIELNHADGRRAVQSPAAGAGQVAASVARRCSGESVGALDRFRRAIDVRFGRPPVRDRDAHRRLGGPHRPAAPADTRCLNAGDDLGRDVLPCRGPEPDEHLVEHDVVEHFDAGAFAAAGRPSAPPGAQQRSTSASHARPAERPQDGVVSARREPAARLPAPSPCRHAARLRPGAGRPPTGSSPRDVPPDDATMTMPLSYGTFSHLCASVVQESASATPSTRCR